MAALGSRVFRERRVFGDLAGTVAGVLSEVASSLAQRDFFRAGAVAAVKAPAVGASGWNGEVFREIGHGLGGGLRLSCRVGVSAAIK